MIDYTIGSEGGYGSRPIVPVDQVGPGVVVARPGERGAMAHVVSESGPGVEYVYFEGGVSPAPMVPATGQPPVDDVYDSLPAWFLLVLS